MKPVHEKDFDFRKKLSEYSSPYHSMNKSFSLGVLFLVSTLSLSLGLLFAANENQISKNTESPKVEKLLDPLITFKSFTPQNFEMIQSSLNSAFSIHSSVYQDKSSVRIGINDEKLDKFQSALLKKIHRSLDMNNVLKDSLIEVDSNVHKVAVTSFDSESKTMIMDVDYALGIKYTTKDNKKFANYTFQKEKISISLDSHSEISEIKLLK